MSVYEGEFYKTLIEWTESEYSEVQYNCAGIIGHIAINSRFRNRMFLYGRSLSLPPSLPPSLCVCVCAQGSTTLGY